MIDVQTLREALKQRNDLLEQVLDITQKQPALIQNEDTDLLLDNIARRQRLIDALLELTKDLPEESRRARDAECAALDERARATQAEIMRQDQINEKAAQTRLENIKAQLRKLRDGKTAFSGYEKIGGDPGATYFDKKN